MTAMFRMELTSALLVFAGHAASLFLMSLRRYTFRRSVMIWAGVLGLSALLTVALLWLSPAEGFLAGQVASLALCAVVFLCTSRGNFLRNLFIFASYINFFLFSIAASQALDDAEVPEVGRVLVAHPCSTVAPVKLEDYTIHENPPGISGSLVEGRICYDAFVLDNKAKAIYYQAQPVTTPSSGGEG